MKKWRLYKRIVKVFDLVIDDICNLPDGYKLWYSIPLRKRQMLRKRWKDHTFTYLFDIQFRVALLRVLMTPAGTHVQEGKALYEWAVDILYAGREKDLYEEWIRLVKDTEA